MSRVVHFSMRAHFRIGSFFDARRHVGTRKWSSNSDNKKVPRVNEDSNPVLDNNRPTLLWSDLVERGTTGQTELNSRSSKQTGREGGNTTEPPRPSGGDYAD